MTDNAVQLVVDRSDWLLISSISQRRDGGRELAPADRCLALQLGSIHRRQGSKVSHGWFVVAVQV